MSPQESAFSWRGGSGRILREYRAEFIVRRDADQATPETYGFALLASICPDSRQTNFDCERFLLSEDIEREYYGGSVVSSGPPLT